MSWDIVFWANKNTVDYVPSCWASDEKPGYYKWPISVSTAKKMKLIDDCLPFDFETPYKLYKGTAKKMRILSLKEAQNSCEKAMVLSNLESEANDEDSNEPLISFKEDQRKNTPIHEDVETSSSFEEDSRAVFDTPVRGSLKRKFVESTRINTTLHESASFSTLTPPATELASQSSSGPISRPISEMSSTSEAAISMSASEELLYSTLLSIRFEIKDLHKRFNELENKRLIQEAHHQSSDSQSARETLDMLSSLPVMNDDQLLQLEEKLSSENTFNNLVESLYLCGGESPHKAIFLMMKKLLTKNVAMIYSGEGKKGKKSFKNLKCYSAITLACRKRFANATEKEIKTSVSFFLAGAKDREGGRKSRQQ